MQQTQPINLEEKNNGVITSLSSAAVIQFLADHENDDEKQLVLKHKNILGIPAPIIAEQIAARRKAKEKLPLYYNTAGIIYPPAVNLEQSSSERTAKNKCSILQAIIREKDLKHHAPVGADLTGGFGVDSFFLSRMFAAFQYIEPNPYLFEIARHNHQRLGANTITHHNTTAEDFLQQLTQPLDLVFIDPSRRTDNKKKVFTFSDSEPDLLFLQTKIFEITSLLLVKASPLLDIKQGIKQLALVKKVFVVAVENEVKELLFLCEKRLSQEPEIIAINLRDDADETSAFWFSEESAVEVPFSPPLTYLYEPNASVLKAGAFKTIAKQFAVSKIAANTHVYTSEQLIIDFPGRVFKVENFVKPDHKLLKQYLPEGRANVLTRNYPLSVDALKKKTGIKDGGEKYLIAFSGVQKKYLVVASRLK